MIPHILNAAEPSLKFANISDEIFVKVSVQSVTSLVVSLSKHVPLASTIVFIHQQLSVIRASIMLEKRRRTWLEGKVRSTITSSHYE